MNCFDALMNRVALSMPLPEAPENNSALPVAQRAELARNTGLVGAVVGVGVLAILASCGAPLGLVIAVLALTALSASGGAYAHRFLSNCVEMRLALFVGRIQNLMNKGVAAETFIHLMKINDYANGSTILDTALRNSQFGPLSILTAKQCEQLMKQHESAITYLEREVLNPQVARVVATGAGPAGYQSIQTSDAIPAPAVIENQTCNGISGVTAGDADDLVEIQLPPQDTRPIYERIDY
jgi:hypothetical protein